MSTSAASATPTVLVFGVAGFIGAHLVREFAEAGYRVAGADRADRLPAPPEGLEFYEQADVRDDERVGTLIHTLAPDAVVNLAALTSVESSWEHPVETMAVNVNGTVNILEAAKELESPPKILLIGSSREYRSTAAPIAEDFPLAAGSPYAISKTAQERFAEAYAHRYGLQVYRTRSFSHIGPGQPTTFAVPDWCSQMAQIEASGKPGTVRVGNLEAVRDFLDVRDAAHAYRLILESDHAGDVFNVGSGIGRRMGDILDHLLCFTSHSVEVEVAPERLSEHDQDGIVSSIVKLQGELGWEPHYPFEQTLADIYAQFA